QVSALVGESDPVVAKLVERGREVDAGCGRGRDRSLAAHRRSPAATRDANGILRTRGRPYANVDEARRPAGDGEKARNATCSRASSVHRSFHGSSVPSSSYTCRPLATARETIMYARSFPGEKRSNSGS